MEWYGKKRSPEEQGKGMRGHGDTLGQGVGKGHAGIEVNTAKKGRARFVLKIRGVYEEKHT